MWRGSFGSGGVGLHLAGSGVGERQGVRQLERLLSPQSQHSTFSPQSTRKSYSLPAERDSATLNVTLRSEGHSAPSRVPPFITLPVRKRGERIGIYPPEQ